MWETGKKEAREEQLDAFKSIETKQVIYLLVVPLWLLRSDVLTDSLQETSMKQYTEQYESSLDSTKSKYKQEAVDAENAKKRTTSIANQNADLGLNKVSDNAAKTQQELIEQVAQAALRDHPSRWSETEIRSLDWYKSKIIKILCMIQIQDLDLRSLRSLAWCKRKIFKNYILARYKCNDVPGW